MKVAILGAGNVGQQVARQLVSEGKNVVLIEKNADVAQRVSNTLDCLVVTDEGSDPAVLRQAGVADADFFLSLTGSDETNMVACSIVAREFPKPMKVARVRTPAYVTLLTSAQQGFLGVDRVINPEEEASRAILSSIAHGVVSDVMDLGSSDLHLQSLRIEEQSPLAGRSVRVIRQEMGREFLIPVIVRDREVLVPSGETVVEEGDEVSIVADDATLAAVFEAAGRPRTVFKHIVVFGGGRIAANLIEELGGHRPARGVRRTLSGFARGRRHLTVFEQSVDRCKHLAERYPDILVNHADVSEETSFIDERMSGYDLAVAVTGNQELNLVTAADAKINGTKRSIALVIKNDYLRIARRMPIDVTISLKASVARSLLTIIRRGVLRSIQSVGESELEILELAVDGTSGLSGRAIRDLDLPRDCLVLFAVRGGRTLLPDGSLTLAEGDRIGIIARRNAIERLEERFLPRP